MNKHEKAKAERLSHIRRLEGALDGEYQRAVVQLEEAAHALDLGDGDGSLTALRDALRRHDLLGRGLDLLGEMAEFDREVEARA
jgi:hypothetical protein